MLPLPLSLSPHLVTPDGADERVVARADAAADHHVGPLDDLPGRLDVCHLENRRRPSWTPTGASGHWRKPTTTMTSVLLMLLMLPLPPPLFPWTEGMLVASASADCDTFFTHPFADEVV